MKKKTFDESDIRMLKSCYAYGYLGWSDYYLNIVKKYGKRATEKEVKKLESEYRVESNVHTDGEGCTYNSLVKR